MHLKHAITALIQVFPVNSVINQAHFLVFIGVTLGIGAISALIMMLFDKNKSLSGGWEMFAFIIVFGVGGITMTSAGLYVMVTLHS